jgi:hypothetical protein
MEKERKMRMTWTRNIVVLDKGQLEMQGLWPWYEVSE